MLKILKNKFFYYTVASFLLLPTSLHSKEIKSLEIRDFKDIESATIKTSSKAKAKSNKEIKIRNIGEEPNYISPVDLGDQNDVEVRDITDGEILPNFARKKSVDTAINIERQNMVLRDNLMEDANRDDSQIYLFNLIISGYDLGTIVGFVEFDDDGNPKKVVVPFGEILSLLELQINVDNANGVASGWFINEDRKFSMDLKSKTTNSDGNNFALDSTKVEIDFGEIYVDNDFLPKIFPFRLVPNLLDSTLIVESREKLPLEIQIAMEKRQRQFKKSERRVRPEDVDYAINKDRFSLPFVDLSSSYTTSTDKNTTNGQKESNEDWGYTLYGKNIFFTMDAEWYISDTSDYKTADAEFKANKYFFNDKERPFDILRQVEVGDTYSYNVPAATTRKAGRGVKLSSFHKGSSSINNTVDIIGYLENGWTVELYKDDTLTDYQTDPIDNGYEFKDLPVSVGSNTYKLVFYGPQGQVREEERFFYIKSKSALKDELGFELSLTQDDRYLVESNQDKGDQDQKDLSTVLSTNYGLTDHFVLLGGGAYVTDPSKTSTSALNQNLDTDFEFVGFDADIEKGSFEYLSIYANRSDKFIHSLSYNRGKDRVIPANLIFDYQYFGDVRTKDSYHFSDYAYDYWQGRLNTNFKFSRALTFPFEFMMEQAQSIQSKDEGYKFESRLSYNLFRRYYFTLTGSKTRYYTGVTSSDIGLLFNTRFNKTQIKGGVYYDIEPTERISSFNSDLNYYFTRNFIGMLGWTRNYSYTTLAQNNTIRSEKNTYDVGMSYLQNNLGNFGLKYTWDTDYYSAVNLTYSTGIGFSTETKPIVNGSGFGYSGAMMSRVFIDEDNDGEFDEGSDSLIEGVQFNKKPSSLKTDESGQAILPKVGSYTLKKIGAKPGTFGDDIFLAPRNEYEYYITKPGSIVKVDVPIIHIGDIEGGVFDKNENGISGIKLSLIDKNGMVTQEVVTDSEGYFVFIESPVGDYYIRTNENQMRFMNYRSLNPLKVKITKDEPIVFLDDIILQKGFKESDLILQNDAVIEKKVKIDNDGEQSNRTIIDEKPDYLKKESDDGSVLEINKVKEIIAEDAIILNDNSGNKIDGSQPVNEDGGKKKIILDDKTILDGLHESENTSKTILDDKNIVADAENNDIARLEKTNIRSEEGVVVLNSEVGYNEVVKDVSEIEVGGSDVASDEVLSNKNLYSGNNEVTKEVMSGVGIVSAEEMAKVGDDKDDNNELLEIDNNNEKEISDDPVITDEQGAPNNEEIIAEDDSEKDGGIASFDDEISSEISDDFDFGSELEGSEFATLSRELEDDVDVRLQESISEDGVRNNLKEDVVVRADRKIILDDKTILDGLKEKNTTSVNIEKTDKVEEVVAPKKVETPKIAPKTEDGVLILNENEVLGDEVKPTIVDKKKQVVLDKKVTVEDDEMMKDLPNDELLIIDGILH